MRFSTEEFATEVVADVTKRRGNAPRAVYALAWSSGGPAAYSLALQAQPKLDGALVAMSVFKPETLPDLSAAKGRAFYLLHSPQDFIPFAMAEKARDALRANGAEVQLQSYAGGHGWHGDVFGTISNGIHWLERNPPKPK
jgi:predicted esterase